MRYAFGALMASVLVGAVAAVPATAYESDQYSNRLVDIDDSLEQLDALVNEALAEIVDGWSGPPGDYRFARHVYWKLGGLHWVDHIERRAMRDAAIDRLPQRRRDSIYAGAPIHATRTLFVFGVGTTVKIDGTLVGSDKLGHFFSQGVKYYKSYLHGESLDEVLERGRFNERWLFGQCATGVYSNADLVANYEGFLFYRSLFEDGVVAGKPAIVHWRRGVPELQRPFTWADHVNDYWDEALNPSYFTPSLARFMLEEALPQLCDDYLARPERFVPVHGDALAKRYEGLGMRPAIRFRLDVVCGGSVVGAGRPTFVRSPARRR